MGGLLAKIGAWLSSFLAELFGRQMENARQTNRDIQTGRDQATKEGLEDALERSEESKENKQEVANSSDDDIDDLMRDPRSR